MVFSVIINEQIIQVNLKFFAFVSIILKMTNVLHPNRICKPAFWWRSKDELVRDVLLWTLTYGQAKAGRPARTYIQHLCEDTGCNLEDLPVAMNDREKWREMVKDICAGGTTWWWWWWRWWLLTRFYFSYYICFLFSF